MVTANLALALHEAGFRTLVVAADLDTPVLERVLDVPVAPGLAEIFLRGDELPLEIESPYGVRVVPRGENASAARELYAGSRFEFLIAGLKSEADYVLISAPPATTADGDAVAAVADSVVLVGRDMVTTHAEVGSILHRYSRLGVSCLGLVFAAKVKGRLTLRPNRPEPARAESPDGSAGGQFRPSASRPSASRTMAAPSVESLPDEDVDLELDDEDLEVPTGRRDEARVPDTHD
jgi:hypothetical protein